MNERRYRIEERAGNRVMWKREYRTRADALSAFTVNVRYRVYPDRRLVLVGPDHCVLPGARDA